MVITDDTDPARVLAARRAAYQVNQAAYLRLKGEIDARYPKGWFVGIDGGRVIADGATFEAVDARLTELGVPRPGGFVIRAGAEPAECVYIA